MTSIISFNVNGIRAAFKKGLLDFLTDARPDMLLLQEVKAHPEQVEPALLAPEGYTSLWRPARRKGYSGVAAYVRQEPRSEQPLGQAEFDDEGRVQQLEYDHFTVINAYFPNSQHEGKRLDYKLAFCHALQEHMDGLRAAGRHVIVTGDFNIAHKPIDLARPKQNVRNPGYLPEERAWMDSFVDQGGWVDAFRRQHPDEPEHYTWWSYRSGARERNIGWRLDYFCVNPEFADRVQDVTHLTQVHGSDHCPISLKVKS